MAATKLILLFAIVAYLSATASAAVLDASIVVNPGTPEEQLVATVSNTVYDDNTDTKTIPMNTADKDGDKPRYLIRDNKFSVNSLKSLAG